MIMYFQYQLQLRNDNHRAIGFQEVSAAEGKEEYVIFAVRYILAEEIFYLFKSSSSLTVNQTLSRMKHWLQYVALNTIKKMLDEPLCQEWEWLRHLSPRCSGSHKICSQRPWWSPWIRLGHHTHVGQWVESAQPLWSVGCLSRQSDFLREHYRTDSGTRWRSPQSFLTYNNSLQQSFYNLRKMQLTNEPYELIILCLLIGTSRRYIVASKCWSRSIPWITLDCVPSDNFFTFENRIEENECMRTIIGANILHKSR